MRLSADSEAAYSFYHGGEAGRDKKDRRVTLIPGGLVTSVSLDPYCCLLCAFFFLLHCIYPLCLAHRRAIISK